MMAREWQPGDVASVLFDGMQAAYRTQRGWTFIDGSTSGENADGYGFRPLVVIDPENREQVARVAEALEASYLADDRDAEPDYDFRVTQAALRSLIEPPKPDEPTGLGAVVEDNRGNRWIRTGDDRLAAPWFRRNTPAAPQYESWASVDAVRVLSEGIQP